MATPEAGTPEPIEADLPSASHELGDVQSEEALALRRLGEADELLRAGLAAVEQGAVRLQLDEAVSLSVPLPPSPVALSLALAATEGDPALTPDDVAALQRTIGETLSGELDIDLDEALLRLIWRPLGPHAQAEATRRARAVAEHLTALRVAAREQGAWSSPLRALTDRLAEHRGRAERLARAFRDHAVVRLPGLGVMHLLAHRTDPADPEAPRLVVLQSDPDLLSPNTGRGLFVALRLPEWGPTGRLAHLAASLCRDLAKRLDLSARRSDALEMLGDWAEPHHTLLLTLAEAPGRTFDDYLWQLLDLIRFAESLVRWVTRGHSPFELMGIEDPCSNAVAVESPPVAAPVPAAVEPEVPSLPSVEPVPTPAPTPPKAERPAPAPAQEPVPAPPAPPAPTDEPAAAEDVATAWGRPIPPPRRPGRSNAIDRLSTREVVQKLGLKEEADVDVFMSHPGYNPQKTIDIMSLALNIDKDEAREIVESAPSLVVGPVTRTRAARIKTILEGTGATIRVVPTGEAAPTEEDA